MKTIVFVGPTLRVQEVERDLAGATICPPVGCGDVLEAARAGFARIALIDGYFDQRQPVWHKEILWALQQGCAVYGAASMGALRAAELHAFGMVGIGRIFEWYRDGVLEADDEVAVCHGDESSAFRPLSVALVNIRVTLRRAVSEGVASVADAHELTALAQALFYPDRSYDAVLRAAGGDRRRWATLQSWLSAPHHRIDQKALDAQRVLEHLANGSEIAPRVPFHLAETEAWHELMRRQARPARRETSRRAQGGNRS